MQVREKKKKIAQEHEEEEHQQQQQGIRGREEMRALPRSVC
jgi:hypothetical protein